VQVSDRLLMGISLAFCGLGCLAMVSWTGGHIALGMYLVSFTLVLSFTNILEGVSMSVLSKVIHPDIANGTFNAGARCAVVPCARSSRGGLVRCDGAAASVLSLPRVVGRHHACICTLALHVAAPAGLRCA
jgi:hypothetical protein